MPPGAVSVWAQARALRGAGPGSAAIRARFCPGRARGAGQPRPAGRPAGAGRGPRPGGADKKGDKAAGGAGRR